MARGYIPLDRDQRFLLPPDMREWLPADHLVWWLLEVVDRLDTSVFHQHRRLGGQGRAGYDPDMLLSLLVYAYCHRVRSSRQIERLCHTDVAFRVICAGPIPDHSTIARFRQEYDRAAQAMFVQVLELCVRAGLGRVGVVALDGTKISADASIGANRSRGWLVDQVAAMFADADATDRAEDDRYGPDRGDEMPADMGDPLKRRARLQAALAALEARDAETLPVPVTDWDARVARAEEGVVAARAAWQIAQFAKADGRGRRRSYPEGSRVAKAQRRVERLAARAAAHAAAHAAGGAGPEAQVNLTDPDSRILHTRNGWVQGYNAQAVVNDIGIVIAAEVCTDANDLNQFIPMLETLTATQTLTGPVGVILADAGYCSLANLTAPGPTRLIATANAHTAHKANKPLTAGPPPPDANPIQAMDHTLRTPEAKHLYTQRATTVEPGFGHIKHNLGFNRFSRRGKTAAQAEWQLIATIANLTKLHRWYPTAIRT
jgi:transposase